MEKKKNEHPSIPFLKSLYQHCIEGFINLRFLPSKENLFIPLSEITSVPNILETHKGQNAYFGVATRVEGNGSKDGILQIPTLWVDIDFKEMPKERVDQIRQRCRNFFFKPSFTILSGGGVHLYWLLKEPVSREDLSRVEGLLKRNASYFGGDMSSTDASRILRLPGGQNYKYSPPREVVIKYFHPERQYGIDDFDSLLPPIERTVNGAGKPHLPKGWEKELLEGVPERERNVAITRLAGRYIGKGLSRDEILPILLDANSRFKPPIEDKEVETCLDSVMKTHQRNHPETGTEGKQDSSGHHFSLIQAKDIVSSPEDEADWIWEGILPSGGLSLVIGKPKAGKTTLAFNLAVALSRGETFLGRKTKQGTVVYLALEEKKGELQKKLSQLGVKDEPLYFHFGPAPVEAIKEVEPLIKDTGAKFLVIDILQKFCRVKDLNDYAQVTRALEPLMATARQLNCHIEFTHHAGKRDREDGDDILGSTALLGGVDTSIHIKKREKHRTLFTIQRYGNDFPETVITLKEDGSLEATGSREEVEIQEALPFILEKLEEGPLSEKEIWGRVEKGHSLVSKGLRILVERGQIKRTGEGKRGKPFMYEKDSLLLSSVYMEESRREIKDGVNPKESLESFSPDDFEKNEEAGEGMRREFLTPKKRGETSLLEGEI